MRVIAKCAINFILKKAFLGQTKMGQKMTGRWAGLVAAQKAIAGIQFLASSTLIELY